MGDTDDRFSEISSVKPIAWHGSRGCDRGHLVMM
jgi:hypothetical protein